MGFFSKVKKVVTRAGKDFGVIDRSKKPKPAAADPDPINPLTGRPMSQDGGGMQGPAQGLPAQDAGALGTSYLQQPVPMTQRIPQGLGSDVFRSTLAPLQQQGYGLGQVDPRFLQGIMQQRGGSNAAIPFAQPGQPPPGAPVSVQSNMMFPGMAPPGMQSPPQGLGQRPFMGGGLGRFAYNNRFMR